MDKIRRAILPALVVVILLGALISRLSSCAQGGAPAADHPVRASASSSASPSAAPSPSVVRPTAPYSDTEIKTIYNSLGLSLVEIRDAGDVTMVHYYKPTGVAGEIISRFDWFDRSTGTRALVYGWAYTDQFDIKPDKSFTVLTTGLSHINGTQAFPVIFRSAYSDIDGTIQFTGSEEKYYAPLDKSYTLGSERHECLTDVNFNPEFVSLGFGTQPGYEGEFYTAYESIPKMTTKHEAGFAVITLYKTILADAFKKPTDKENAYCRLASVTCDGTDTIIKLQLNEATVSRYHVSSERSPKTGLPYAVFEYTKAAPSYPTGW